MGRRFWRAALVCAALGALALPSAAQAQGQGKRVMLYTGTTGLPSHGRHQQRPAGHPEQARSARIHGRLGGLQPPRRRGAGNCNNADKNPRIFTDANLARYDAVVMLNMSWKFAGGNLPGPLLEAPQKDAIIKYVQNGGGIAAIHNATDAGAGQSIWDWWDGGPNSRRRHDDARPRGDERHRQRGDRAGVRPEPPVDQGPPGHVDVHGRALQLPAQRPRRPPRARHVRRAHVQPGRQRPRPGSPDHVVQALRRRQPQRRHADAPHLPATAAPGSPAWATSASATPRTAATPTW